MSTYQETLDWMFSRLPMYQRQGASAFRKDLTNIRLLSEYLDHPEQYLKCIHIAGTNGKGSTSHMLASVLIESGYKVGLYTSPHLKDFRERITINGHKIAETDVVAFIDMHRNFFERHDLSFFEMTVGLAFDYFHAQLSLPGLSRTFATVLACSRSPTRELVYLITAASSPRTEYGRFGEG